MRIVCPSCQAAYEVPDKLLGGGVRKVRCARCGTEWVPAADPAAPPEAPAIVPLLPPDDAPASAAVAPGPPAPAPPVAEPPSPPAPMLPRPGPDRAAEIPKPREERGLAVLAGLAWLASLLLLAGAAWATITWRTEIMAAWAPSRRLFLLLGLA